MANSEVWDMSTKLRLSKECSKVVSEGTKERTESATRQTSPALTRLMKLRLFCSISSSMFVAWTQFMIEDDICILQG